LELNRTKDAVAAFHRALRAKPDEEREGAVSRERDRLDGLETRIRTPTPPIPRSGTGV
jgi:hypothetical protein